jgi:uncharacterized protein (DUF2141 family)
LTIEREPAGIAAGRRSKAMKLSMQRGGVAAGVLALVVLLSSSSSADAPLTGLITVRVAGLRSNDGQVGCALYNSAKGYPTDASAALERRFCPIDKSASVCAFGPVPAGTYAVACFHDENNNGKLDTGLFGIPKEGVCASNGATGFMGPPSFRDAKFDTSGTPRDVSARMKY